MTTMNLKPISWVGDMYNKFESLCLEVEEAICQDTVKYVEDQMQTVGVGVKKFYSEVMQDLLPPSLLDTVKEENSDVVVSNKSKVTNEKKSVNIEAEQMVNNSDGAANGNNSVDYASCHTAQCNVNKPFESTSRDTVEDQCVNEDIENQCAELDLPDLDTYATDDLYEKAGSECMPLSATSSPNESMTKASVEEVTHRDIQNESTEPLFGLVDVCSNSNSMVEASCSEKDGVKIADQKAEGYESVGVVNGSETMVPLIGNLFPDFDGTSNSQAAYKIESGFDEQVVLLEKQNDVVKLGESCVLVEKSEHSFRIPFEHKQKSYKKKIRDVFIQRRWSKGKQDKKQHALWYEELSAKNSVPTSLMHANTKQSRSNESVESEWELL